MNELLTELQRTQIEILKVIDGICAVHGLRYSLYAGTLLGAVRHQGFIPWDDDLDICMPREDYDRLIALWDTVAPKGYLLQNKENTPRFTQSFTKIRKDHTTFLQDEKEIGAYHTGIFVDIFPVDRIPDRKLRRMLFYWHGMQYQLYTREFVPPKAGRLTRLVSAILLKMTPADRRPAKRQKLLNKLTAYNGDRSLQTVTIETVGSMKQHHTADMIDNYVRLPFGADEFQCFADWDHHLHTKYGDYMKLPPEEERVWKHHPICIDFEKNYEERT